MKAFQILTMMLWITPIVIQSIIAIVMFRRKLVAVFPVFFTYSLLLPAREILLLFVRNPNTYSRIYFLGEAVVVALSLGVIYEVIWHLVRPYPFLRQFVFRCFWVVAAAGLALGLAMFLSASRSARPDPLLETIILAERSVRFLQSCWLVVLVLLMSRLGLTWQYYAVGIATGFGLYSASDLTLLELRVHLHWINDKTLVLLNSAAYNVAVGIWARYFLPPRPSTETIVVNLPSTEIARWNNALSEYLKQ